MNTKSLIFIIVLFLMTIPMAESRTMNDRNIDGFWEDAIGQPAQDVFYFWGNGKSSVSVYEDAMSKGKLFMPVEKWEFRICSNRLSTELQKFSNSNIGGGIYADTYTVQAFRYNSSDNNYLYEIAWYLQPSPVKDEYGVTHEGVYYNLTIETDAGDELQIGGRRGVTFQQGDSGYSSFYGTKLYTKVRLKYYGLDERFPVIDK